MTRTIDGFVFTSLLGNLALDIVNTLSEHLLQHILGLDLLSAKCPDHPQTLLLHRNHLFEAVYQLLVSAQSGIVNDIR